VEVLGSESEGVGVSNNAMAVVCPRPLISTMVSGGGLGLTAAGAVLPLVPLSGAVPGSPEAHYRARGGGDIRGDVELQELAGAKPQGKHSEALPTSSSAVEHSNSPSGSGSSSSSSSSSSSMTGSSSGVVNIGDDGGQRLFHDHPGREPLVMCGYVLAAHLQKILSKRAFLQPGSGGSATLSGGFDTQRPYQPRKVAVRPPARERTYVSFSFLDLSVCLVCVLHVERK
jgi:hypothetical protein